MMLCREPIRLSAFAMIFACLLVSAVLPSMAEKPVTLGTRDTRLTLVAGAHGPRVMGLAGTGGFSSGNEAEEILPATVWIDEKPVAVSWKLDGKRTVADGRRVEFVYVSGAGEPKLTARSLWQARADFGPVEHTITVESRDGREMWLPMIDSLSLKLDHATGADGQPLRHFSVEKGADTPSAEGTHESAIGEGFAWTGMSSTYARPYPNTAREIIPFEMVYDSGAMQAGWYAGIEFSGRVRIGLERAGGRLTTVLGLNPEPGPFRTRLAPGESFVTPTVFLGAFAGGLDGAGNQLRPWVRAVLGNPLTWKDAKYPLTNNNSWGSGMAVDEALSLRMLHDSKELGLEMFHIDAGWFRAVGDWVPDAKKFPHGLAAIADEAHALGLRFGIWTDWTQAALSTEPGAMNVRDPKVRDWMVADVGADWKPEEFKGQTIDIGVPAARDWAAAEVKRIVETNHLDMLEHDGYLVAQGCLRTDHPHAAPIQSTVKVTHDWGSDFVSANNSTDVSYHAVRAYYSIYEQVRREHPGLLFEICNDGGRMVDFGSAAHGDYFSITDTYDPLSNRRAFYDTSFALPAAMLESYVEKWPTPSLDNFRYMLRSGMMGWVTVMQDTTAWSGEQHDAAKREIALYQQRLRPLIRDAELFHVAGRPDGVHWDGMEYWDPARETGAVYAFRGSTADEAEHTYKLAGLKAEARYALHFEDGSQADQEATGGELMREGLLVRLGHPLSSEIVFLTELPLKAAQPAKE